MKILNVRCGYIFLISSCYKKDTALNKLLSKVNSIITSDVNYLNKKSIFLDDEISSIL